MDKPAMVLRDAVEQALRLAAEGKKPENIAPALKEGLNALLVLRSAHRDYCDDTESLRELTTTAKSTLDETNLQLQNLVYERRHYANEIYACENFPSKYSEDQMELISEEEFMQTAPQAHTQSEDSHERMKQRILWETHQRNQALSRFEALKSMKNAREADLATKRRQLDQYSSTLKSLKRTAQPLQQQLKMQPLEGIIQNSAAQLLPLPLYILYTQAAAAATAFGLGVSPTIQGSMEEAEAELNAASDSASRLHSSQLMTERDPNVRAAKRAKLMSSPQLMYKVMHH